MSKDQLICHKGYVNDVKYENHRFLAEFMIRLYPDENHMEGFELGREDVHYILDSLFMVFKANVDEKVYFDKREFVKDYGDDALIIRLMRTFQELLLKFENDDIDKYYYQSR